MKIEKVEIVNFKGIAGLEKELSGHSVYVVGANGSGKSSFIDAVFCALTGDNLPDEPIQRGKSEAKIEVVLDSGLVVIVEFQKVRKKGANGITQKLTLVQDGEVIKETPRARLNSIVKTINFDPFEFMGLSPKEKLDYFCKISGLNVAAIDAEYKENLELIALDTKELRRIDLVPFDEKLAASELVSISGIIQSLEEARTKNQKITDFEQKLQEKRDRVEEIESEVGRLRAQIDELLSERTHLGEAVIPQGEAWLAKQTKIDLEPLIARSKNVEGENEKIRIAKEAKAGNERREKLQESIEITVEANKVLRKQKEDLVGKALEGVDGMTFDGEIFLLDGLPFDKNQNNTSGQIIAGLKIGLKMVGEVKIARFEGSLLDRAHLEEVEAWGLKNGLQLFIEIVDRDNGGLSIEISEN